MNRLSPIITASSAFVLLVVGYACFPSRMNELTMWTVFGIPMWMLGPTLAAGLIGVTVFQIASTRRPARANA